MSNRLEIIGKKDSEPPWYDIAEVLDRTDKYVLETGSFKGEEAPTIIGGSHKIFQTQKKILFDANEKAMGIIGISIDITKEKQFEIVKKTKEHFYWKNKEGIYLDCNSAVVEAAGLQSVQDVIGKTDYDIYNKEIADTLRATDLRIMANGMPEVLEEMGYRNDRTIGIFLTYKFPLHDINGNVNSIMGFSTDITLQKQAEMAKADFISNMEHDLRTPFAGISGIALMLMRWKMTLIKKRCSSY